LYFRQYPINDHRQQQLQLTGQSFHQQRQSYIVQAVNLNKDGCDLVAKKAVLGSPVARNTGAGTYDGTYGGYTAQKPVSADAYNQAYTFNVDVELALVGGSGSGGYYSWLAEYQAVLQVDVFVGIISAGALLKAQRISINMLRVEMAVGYGLETGQGSNPVIRLRMSRDGGLQFGDWQNIEVGKTGEYSKRVIARRLGQFKPPYVIAEISISDPVPRRISGIYFNEGF